MINLLPDEIKEEITYGRRNRVILRWIFALIIVMAGIGAMTIFGQLYITKNVRKLDATANLTKQRITSQNLESTQKDLQRLSDNFKTVSQLLGKQFLFSKLFVKIGGVIPSGAVLSGITLQASNTALDLNIVATNREAASQAFVNISSPNNGLFEKADLVSVNCATQSVNNTNPTVANKYPCSSTIKVVLKPDSNLYFLNSLTGAKR